MTDTKGERSVILKPPGDGAYRVTIVGAKNDNVINSLVTGGHAGTAKLVPGDYTAYIESVSSPGNTVTTFSVPSKVDVPSVIELGPNPDPELIKRNPEDFPTQSRRSG